MYLTSSKLPLYPFSSPCKATCKNISLLDKALKKDPGQLGGRKGTFLTR